MAAMAVFVWYVGLYHEKFYGKYHVFCYWSVLVLVFACIKGQAKCRHSSSVPYLLQLMFNPICGCFLILCMALHAVLTAGTRGRCPNRLAHWHNPAPYRLSPVGHCPWLAQGPKLCSPPAQPYLDWARTAIDSHQFKMSFTWKFKSACCWGALPHADGAGLAESHLLSQCWLSL